MVGQEKRREKLSFYIPLLYRILEPLQVTENKSVFPQEQQPVTFSGDVWLLALLGFFFING
jgi:hypothetical protein